MLGAGQLSAIDLDAVAFVEAAGSAGLDAVSLFLNPAGGRSAFPLTTQDNAAAVRHALGAAGVQLANIECFMLTPSTRVADYGPAIELGASLGARNLTALLYDADAARVCDNLRALHALAAGAGLGVGIEFMPLTPGWKTLPAVRSLVESLQLPGLRVAIDCLHLVRSGGSPADVAALPASLISHVQLCDSHDLEPGSTYYEEAGTRRLAPGEGRFPLSGLLCAVPETVYLEIEVPDPDGGPTAERLRRMAESTRRLITMARGG